MKIKDINVKNIKGLERGGIYWVQVGGDLKENSVADIGCELEILLREYDIKVIVSNEDVSFINMPRGLELGRVE